MNENLSRLTIVVPTYERHDSLARFLKYYSPFSVNLIVVDGSSAPFDHAPFASETCKLQYFHMPVSIEERIAFATSLCTTEFAVFACDDEYYLESALSRAVENLTRDDSLSATYGRCAAFVVDDSGVQLGLYYNFLKNYNDSNPLPSERVRHVTSCFQIISGLYYSVIRTSAFKASVKVAIKHRYSCTYVNELLFSLSLVIQGGVKSFEDLMWLRNLQSPPVSMAGWNRKLDMHEWYTDPAYSDEVSNMMTTLSGFYDGFVVNKDTEFSLQEFLNEMIIFDKKLSMRVIEPEKAYAFNSSIFLLLCEKFAIPVDEKSLRAAERLELEAQAETSETIQLKTRITTW